MMKIKVKNSDVRRVLIGAAVLLLLIIASYIGEKIYLSSGSSNAKVVKVQQNDKAVAYLNSDIISQLAEQTSAKGDEQGAALLDVLHAAGINRFSSVVLTGNGKGLVFHEDEIDGILYLRPTGNGTVGLYNYGASSSALIAAVSVIEVESP